MNPTFSRPALAIAAATALVTAPASFAHEEAASASHPNSIQPETTLSVSASGEVSRAPDMVTITAGVQTDSPTASEAMSQNATRMEGVYAALAEAGVEERNMQTSSLSLQPRYDYSGREDGSPPKVVGYTASNQLTVTVNDLENLGQTMDAVVAQGGNTISGINFELEDPSEARDEARRKAVEKAMARAELYAEATGYSVARIVTINETSSSQPPRPMAMMAMRAESGQADTKVSGGEVGYSVNVDITFELHK
ncbi:SIMPL domain-containing protein [Henriciella sp.]|uniref:SIMPL domain-containing protein n=1 Tax=Henriciella sp. TaxID=1968823 RepID=UPI0026152BF0|nr:SIMPL domain-containing protein [Henriciella sp.]